LSALAIADPLKVFTALAVVSVVYEAQRAETFRFLHGVRQTEGFCTDPFLLCDTLKSSARLSTDFTV
jgi:hypothetical protein